MQKLKQNVMSEIVKNRFDNNPIKYYRKQLLNNTLIIANKYVFYIFNNTLTYNFLMDRELITESDQIIKFFNDFDFDNMIEVKNPPKTTELCVEGKKTKCISFPESVKECYNTKHINKFGKGKKISYCLIPIKEQEHKALGVKINYQLVGLILPIIIVKDK